VFHHIDEAGLGPGELLVELGVQQGAVIVLEQREGVGLETDLLLGAQRLFQGVLFRLHLPLERVQGA
jgi:hypothetical protein